MVDVKLVAHSLGVNGETPEEILAVAFGKCYQKPARIEVIQRHMAHQSVFEHISFTFDMTMSRVAWEQQVRHRLASYTAQSHRYTEPTLDDTYVYIPSEVKEEDIEEWKSDCEKIYSIYRKWRDEKGVKKETARYLINKGVGINVSVTMNLRSLLNFLALRTNKNAQEEIRVIAEKTWECVKPLFPNIGQDLERYFRSSGH